MALTDQQIRDLGILYLPLQQYLANPFQYNPNEETEETAALPVNLTGSNVGGGGGGGGASPFDLTPTFTTERRPAPTTDFNINPAAFLTGKGRTDPMGSDMDYFLNLPADRRFSFGFDIDSDFPGSPNYKPPSKFFEEPNLIDRGIGAFRNPLNPNATNYNPDLVGQLNYLEGQDGLIGRSSVGLKYGPESVLFGKNVISGFGTNDYEEALNKYIESAKLKLRREKKKNTRQNK